MTAEWFQWILLQFCLKPYNLSRDVNRSPEGKTREKPLIVVSGINIFQGGMLTIFKECLRELNDTFSENYKLEAFVHKLELFEEEHLENILLHELPKSRKRWMYRMYYEYFHFRKVSKMLKPYLWLSLHDTSPFLLNTQKQCVYCHNPSIFHQTKLKTLYYDKTHFLFTLFYRFLYQINIKKNNYVIVQQDWIRQNFSKYYNIPASNILVAYPNSINSSANVPKNSIKAHNAKTVFFYPAFPRTFKNFEVLVEAVHLLNNLGITNFRLDLTITGEENLYAKKIKQMACENAHITFMGKLALEEVQNEYKSADVLIFPSTLETWGLPLSEFKQFEKPILAADLPYAHETIGTYSKAGFFDPNDASKLADIMALIINNQSDGVWAQTFRPKPTPPFTNSWKGMLEFIINN